MSKPKSVRDLMVQKKGNTLVYRWMPRRKTDNNSVGFTTNLARAFTEEFLFFPSKVSGLFNIVKHANKVQPSWMYLLYGGIVTLVFIVPFIILQAAWWQLKRTIKSLWFVATGKVAYHSKDVPKKD